MGLSGAMNQQVAAAVAAEVGEEQPPRIRGRGGAPAFELPRKDVLLRFANLPSRHALYNLCCITYLYLLHYK